MSDFGRLERVDLRAGWISEAQHFTPWLAQEENLALLGEALGLELELEAQERAVGPFRADILCKDTADGTWVLIENQLERTDHTHLGQLITYAAGLHAVTIIWIAARFAEEHRAACDWLNEMTSDDVRIFGLEVELWRIGASPVAPKFNIVSKPNDWSKSVASAKKSIEDSGLTPSQERQLRYWAEFQNLVLARRGPINPVKPQAGSWISHGIGKSGLNLNLATTTRYNSIRVEIYMTGKHAKSDYAELAAQKDLIEQKLGPLLWEPMPDKKDARISMSLAPADPANEDDWPRQLEWLIVGAERFYHIFRPLVMTLRREIPIAETTEAMT